MLGADTVTAEVAAAWERVYWLMAGHSIEREHGLYEQAGGRWRRLPLGNRAVPVDDPSGAVLVSVRPIAGEVPNFLPGQYISVGATMPDGARQLRQYSLVNAPGEDHLTFAVKPVDSLDGQPAGEVSSWIRDNLCVGDLCSTSRFRLGDLPADLLAARTPKSPSS